MPMWKVIPGFSAYEVSGTGRVRRRLSGGSPWGRRNGGWPPGTRLAGAVDEDGYLRYILAADDGRKKNVPAHRLVLLAFVGPPPTPKHEGAHWDGVRLNNRLKNLRWATRKENGEDKTRHGTLRGRQDGEKNRQARLTEDHIRDARASYTGTWGEIARLARKHGVHSSAMRDIIRGKRWRHLNERFAPSPENIRSAPL